MPIREEERDRLQARDWSHAPTNKAVDFNAASSKELEALKWSGYRLNLLSDDLELWAAGRVLSKRKMKDIKGREGAAMAEMHEEAFMTNGSVVIGNEDMKIIENKDGLH